VPRSIASTGAYWATRITSVGLEFALPPMGGGYLDRRWGTGSLLTILGAILGFLMGMIHLLTIAREASATTSGGKVGPKSDGKRTTSDESNESGWADHG
jgi:ATP synthase protein I